MALVETIQDNFDDGVRDSSLWAQYGSGTVQETQGALRIGTTTSAGYSGYTSIQQYNGTSSYTYVEIVDVGDQDISTYGCFPVQWNDYATNDQVNFEVSGGSIKATKNISSVTTTLASTTFNASTHKYVRIRESGGTTYWDYSSNGLTWNNLHSVTNPITVTSIFVSLSAGTYATEGLTTTAAFRGLNISLTAATIKYLSDQKKRAVADNLLVSWKKDFRAGIVVFTIGSSTIGGFDIIGGTDPIISAWNKYLFFDESEYLLNMTWEQQLSLPMGGIAVGMASALLDNTSGRFLPQYMGGSSELFTAILPRRPFIINAGFETNGAGLYEPQFVGELSRNPAVSVSNKTMELQGEDFITYLKNKRVDDTTMFTGQLSSDIIGSLLEDHLGLATAQFDLEQGMNRIPFSMLENGVTFYDYINEVAQAELAQFFQDENGVLRFWNRQHWDSEPYSNPIFNLVTSDVIDAESPDYDHIINVVEVKANPLVKQSTTIFTLESPIELNPGHNEVFIDFENPVLAASAPSYAANTQQDGSGSNVTSSVNIKYTSLFAKAVKYIINNTTSTTAYITSLTISGRWAIPLYEGGIFRSVQDDSSVTAYDERLVQIENDYIQDETWAESYGQIILNAYAEPESLQKIRIRAKPTLHHGDIITWQSRDWIVFSLSNSISTDAGYVQDLHLLKRSGASYLTIGVSIIGGADMVAA